MIGDIILEKSGGGPKQPVGRVAFFDKTDGLYSFSNFTSRIRVINKKQVDPYYLWRSLLFLHKTGATENLQNRTSGIRNLDLNAYKLLQIPLPPLPIQQEIVSEIEGYQKIIDGARAVLDNYRPQILIHPGWPRQELGNLAENLDSRRVPITKEDRKEGPFPYYGASGIVDHVADFILDEEILLVSEDGANLLARSTPIAFSVSGKCWVNNHAHILKFVNSATQKFVEVYLNSISIAEFVTGAAQPKLNQQALNSIPIPIPDDVTVQQTIVAQIEKEQALINASKQLIAIYEQKIKDKIAEVWGAAA